MGSLVIKQRNKHVQVLEVAREASVLLSLLTAWCWRLLCCRLLASGVSREKMGNYM